LRNEEIYAVCNVSHVAARVLRRGRRVLPAGGGYRARTDLYNANIRTVDAGSTANIRRMGSSRAKHVDLGGKTVVPGFIDAPVHGASSGLRHLQEVDCDSRSIAQIQTAIRKRASAVPAGEWVVGFKYDDTRTSEASPLTREDLDAAAPNHPVYLNHRGGHISFVNSRALMAAGVNDRTPDPPGEKFDRDAAGRLTGCRPAPA